MKINQNYTCSKKDYIDARCDALARLISKMPNVNAYNESSHCNGCSNYITIEVLDENDNEEIIEWITVKISDHFKSGCENINFNIMNSVYHGNWKELKADALEIIEHEISKIRQEMAA